MIRHRARPYPMPEQPADREALLKFQRRQLALSKQSKRLRDEYFGREITVDDGWDYYANEGDNWDYYANEGDNLRIPDLEAEVAWLSVDPLDRLEASVEHACQAIYMQREGYWPTDMERHHIAIALVASLDLFASEGHHS